MHGDHIASSYLELDKVKMMLGGQRRRSPLSLEKPLQTGQWELERQIKYGFECMFVWFDGECKQLGPIYRSEWSSATGGFCNTDIIILG